MTQRTATCRCGQLRAITTGEPVRMSVCHCLNCKKRSGSAFAVQARWPSEQVTIAGRSTPFKKVSDSGNWATFHFCPECGSDLYYQNDGPGMDAEQTDLVAIPLGAFDDPFFGRLNYSVYEERKNEWLEIVGENVEHFD
jgi:hypothetical protein